MLPGGQGPEEEQIGGLLKAKAVLADEAVHQILHVNAPVDQLAGGGQLLPVLEVVAKHVTDLGDPCHNAGTVGVTQAPLDLVTLIIGGIDLVIFAVFPA